MRKGGKDLDFSKDYSPKCTASHASVSLCWGQYPNDPAVLLLDPALLGSDLAVLVLDLEKTC